MDSYAFEFYVNNMGKRAKERIERLRIRYSTWLISKRVNSPMSYAEKLIADFLNENGVEFRREVYSAKLYNHKTGNLLFFDFYLPKYNLIIEYDGNHHRCGDKQIEFRDRLKNEFCLKYKVHLLRINKISEIDTLICKKIDEIDPI